MSKKILIIILCSIAFQTNAAEIKNKFYLGGGAGNFLIFPAVNIFAGYHGERFGAEVGDIYSPGNGSVFAIHDTYLDALYFLPISQRLSLKSRFGVGIIAWRGYEGHNFSIRSSGDTVGLRLGTGLEYKIRQRLSAGVGLVFQTITNNHHVAFVPIPSANINLIYYLD